jgi:DNA mismatch repair protein MutS
MKFDDQTLTDLEILPTRGVKTSIFDFFNSAETSGGKKRLERFFADGIQNTAQILTTQETLKYLVKNVESWDFPFEDRLLKDAKRYLKLRIDPTHAKNILELKIVKMRFKENYYDQHAGLLTMRKFLGQLQGFVHKHSSEENLPSRISQILKEISNFLSNSETAVFMKEVNGGEVALKYVYRFDNLFRSEVLNEALNLIEICFELDVYLAFSDIIEEKNFTFPEIVSADTPIFNVKGLYHPFIKDPICYDLNLSDGNGFIFLTGPNMAGKTTFLKACGVSLYLAHLGLAVPAESMEITIFDSLVSSIETQDDLQLGYSYFYSEVRRVKSVAETIRSSESAFIILDELFKGTNVHDAYEASKKVIQGFSNWKNHIYFLSSHLIELVEDEETKKLMNCKCFDAEVIDGEFHFPYTLNDGVSDKRLGLMILEREKVFEILNNAS